MNPTRWARLRLDKLGFVGRGKSRHRPRNEPRLYGGSYPFIQTADVMAADPYITTYSQTYSEFGLRQSKMWPEGTLCMTIAGANTAKVAILKIQACFPDSVIGFIPDQSKADLHFVMYSLGLMKHQFLAVSQGATQDNLSLEKLLSFPLSVPDVYEQRRIAGILSAYDELIENNKRRITLLGKMAEEIYREWFVRLRFPSHKKVRLIKGVPEGWRAVQVGEVCSFAKGKNPEQLFEYPLEGALPYINVDALENTQTSYAVLQRNSVICENDDVLMLMDGARSGFVFRGKKGVVGSTFALIKMESHLTQFVFEYLRASRDAIVASNVGSAIPHASKEFIKRMLMWMPATDGLIDAFNKVYKPICDQRRRLEQMNDALQRTRSLLLPRLISGKVSVEKLNIECPPSMAEELTDEPTAIAYA